MMECSIPGCNKPTGKSSKYCKDHLFVKNNGKGRGHPANDKQCARRNCHQPLYMRPSPYFQSALCKTHEQDRVNGNPEDDQGQQYYLDHLKEI